MKTIQISSFTKLLAIVLTVVFVLSLLPMLAIAQYDLPGSDDWNTANAVNSGDPSLSGTLKDAAAVAALFHNTWHGRYASTFLTVLAFRALPGAAFAVVPVLMLLVLIATTLYFTKILLCGLLKLDIWRWLALSMLLLLCQIQFMPSVAEGVYWCCGALTYTLSYAGTLLLAGMLLKNFLGGEHGRGNLLRGVLSVLLAALSAGLGFTVMILTLGLLAGFVALAVVKKRRDCIIIGALALVVYLAGSVLQIAAPGNAVRAAFEAERYGVVPTPGIPMAIVKSFLFAAGCLIYRLDGSMLLFIFLTALMAVPALQKSGYRFRLPGLVAVGSFCLFATTFAILMYVQNSIGFGRQRNIIVFLEYWFWGGNAVYWTGWGLHKCNRRPDAPLLWARYRECAGFVRRHAVLALGVVAVLLCSTAFRLDVNTRPAMAAVREIASGSAARRYETRMEELLSGEGADRYARPEDSIFLIY